eukprot:UN27358
MHKSKERAMTGLTGGVAMLLKMNRVTWAKGWGKITGPNSISVSKEDGTTEELSTKNIVVATGSESTPLPGVEIDEEFIVTSTGAFRFPNRPRKSSRRWRWRYWFGARIGLESVGFESGSRRVLRPVDAWNGRRSREGDDEIFEETRFGVHNEDRRQERES